MTNIRIAANAVNARVLDADDDIKLELSELLSFEIAGAEHSSAFKSGSWSGRSTLFTYDRAMFPAGLTTLVVSHLKQKGHQVSLIRHPAPEPLGESELKIDSFGYTEEYDYQYKTVEQLIRHRAIIAQVATGGGKSRIGCLAFAKIKRPTLFITTRSVLMHQMKKAFDKSIDYRRANGEKGLNKVFCGVMGDSEWKVSPHLNVAMVQTIQPRLKDPKTEAQMREILEQFEFVILEEAHESSGEGYYSILNACKNAVYRLALTATPFMREDEEANMRLMAVSGLIGIACLRRN
ncbi:DEAD/DEAH box helicase [Xanthomonas phage JGB6]|nr:DEAD/DEAH box helicase [Xanthomonas phage JGB6]